MLYVTTDAGVISDVNDGRKAAYMMMARCGMKEMMKTHVSHMNMVVISCAARVTRLVGVDWVLAIGTCRLFLLPVIG